MSTTVEKISSNKVKLSFDIDAAKFDEAMGKAYIKVRGQVAIPGFRKGHAPPQDDREHVRRRRLL